MKSKYNLCVYFGILFCSLQMNFAQEPREISLTLESVIQIANQNSLESKSIDFSLHESELNLELYKSELLPRLEIKTNPIEYYRFLTRRYDSENNRDIYRLRQNLTNSVNMSVSQNIPFSGGAVFFDFDLARIRNFGDGSFTQYSATPFKVGYYQSVLGYNDFKWRKILEPIKFKTAEKKYLTAYEDLSLLAVEHFFTYASARLNHEIAILGQANADTLYKIGKKKYVLTKLSREELLTLEHDNIVAENNYQISLLELRVAERKLRTFLQLDPNITLRLELPRNIPNWNITKDSAILALKENNAQLAELSQQILAARQNIQKTKAENGINGVFSASFGLNQQSNSFEGAFRNPTDQEIVEFTLNIPLIDWGAKKMKTQLAENQANLLNIQQEQLANNLEVELMGLIELMNIQKKLIQSAAEADTIAQQAYGLGRRRFLLGNINVSQLLTLRSTQENSRKAYLNSLYNFWLSFFTIRKLTLFDFVNNTLIIKRVTME